MISKFAFARRKSSNLFSHFAMAVALAGGAVVGSAMVAPSAYAQDYSKSFVEAYGPLADIAGSETPDWAAARAQYESVVASVETADDRNAAGNLALQIGNGLNDAALQRRGLEMMLASGKVPPEQVGQFQFFVGNLAFNAGDYAASRAALESAIASGYSENDPRGLVIESYMQEGNVAAGVQYVLDESAALEAAGQTVPEQWLLRTLGGAYDADLAAQSIELSKALTRNYPTQTNWINALQVVGAVAPLEPETELDLLRLMRETDSLTRRAEFVRYIEHADPRIMSNEVLPVLADGLAAEIFAADDDYYVEVKSIADSRASQDRADLEEAVADGLAGSAVLALNTGDLLYSVGEYDRAVELYQRSLDEGGERNIALTRIGIAQVQAGNHAAAMETLGQVEGPRQPVAEMWAIYAETQMGA